MPIRVRFAPSPTGELHIGGLRTALFDWLFARKMGGQSVLRLEDTDRTRYKPEAIRSIMDGLRWLGLDWDEGPDLEELQRVGMENAAQYAVGGPYGPYIQSSRLALYKQVAEELIARGLAYRCNCSPERLEAVRQMQRARKEPPMYDRHCRDLPPGTVSPDEPHVVRLRVPLEGQTVIHDAIRGDMVFNNVGQDDQVLLKSDGFPTYHLAVVVDDQYMRITHVLRDERWITSDPKRMLIYQALGWQPPAFYHVPLVNGTDGKPLAKRHGATSVTQFRSQGYLPEAMVNFLAFLGWAPGEGEEREIFSREELTALFDPSHLNKAPAVFSYDKLDWINGVYIRNLPEETLLERLLPFWQQAGLVPDPCPQEERARLLKVIPLVRERIKRLNEIVDWTDFMFREIEPLPAERLVGDKMTPQASLAALRRVRELLASIDPFEAEVLESPMRALAQELGLKAGQLFGIVRWATSGKQVSPPLFGSLEAIGRARTLARLMAAEGALAGKQ